MYFPYGGLWFWPVGDPDAVFFSQQPFSCLGYPGIRLGDHGAQRVALCQEVTRVVLGTETGVCLQGHPVVPVQCGMVAQLDELGRYLCDLHRHFAFHCRGCDTYMPHGDGGFCSQACDDAYVYDDA